jgi:hypothetical protein
MSTSTSFFLRICAGTAGLFISCASAFAAELTLQKVSDDIGLVSYNMTDLHTKARALYVSSGNDLVQANRMIDSVPSSAYSFAVNDATPAVIVDLGRSVTLRRVSALYSQTHVGVDFFVLRSLPTTADEKASASGFSRTLHLDNAAIAKLTPVGSVLDEGTGRATVEFPEMVGRYVMIRWTPTHQDRSFDVAEISVVGKASDPGLTIAQIAAARRGDGKTVVDAKDIGGGKDAKEIPSEAPPAEGPPVGLPQQPPFTFTPLVQETSP